MNIVIKYIKNTKINYNYKEIIQKIEEINENRLNLQCK